MRRVPYQQGRRQGKGEVAGESKEKKRDKTTHQGCLEHVALGKEALQAVLLLCDHALRLVYGLDVLVEGCTSQGPFQLLAARALLLVHLDAMQQMMTT